MHTCRAEKLEVKWVHNGEKFVGHFECHCGKTYTWESLESLIPTVELGTQSEHVHMADWVNEDGEATCECGLKVMKVIKWEPAE